MKHSGPASRTQKIAAEKYKKIKIRNLDKLRYGKYHKTGRWDTEAEVLSKRPDGLSYIIKDETGQQLIRGRRLLEPKPAPKTSD